MDEEIIGMVGFMCLCFVIIATVVGFCSAPSNSEMLSGDEQRQWMQHYSGDYSYVENPYE